MQALKDGANQLKENFSAKGSEASKEANKNVAEDSNQSLGTRAQAGKDAISDKMDQHSSETQANAYEAKRKANEP